MSLISCRLGSNSGHASERGDSFTHAKTLAEWTLEPVLELKASIDWHRLDYSLTELRRRSWESIVQPPKPVQFDGVPTLLSGFGKGLGTPTAWIVPRINDFAERYGI